jgi:hypothetical protein
MQKQKHNLDNTCVMQHMLGVTIDIMVILDSLLLVMAYCHTPLECYYIGSVNHMLYVLDNVKIFIHKHHIKVRQNKENKPDHHSRYLYYHSIVYVIVYV